MSRYIDADKVLEKMRNTFDMQDLYLPIHFKDFIIDDMPTADVRENVHGEWIEIHWKAFRCSECKKVSEYYTNFCPNCGADCRGDGHE